MANEGRRIPDERSAEDRMPTKSVDKDKLRTSYLPVRTRLLARRKLEETRLAKTREALLRIDREIAALDRQQRQIARDGG